MVAPRTVVVVNPSSQGGKLGKRWREVAETLGRAFPFDEVMTQARGDAITLTREALRGGAERIVAIGGDGTINEVVNGFFEEGKAIAPDASLALIPFGTGGDFRKTALVPNDTAKAAAVIAANHRKRIDVGSMTYVDSEGRPASRMFANIASFGLSGVLDRLINASGKKLGGKLGYLAAGARATLTYKNKRVQLQFDGRDRVETTIYTVAVANGKYFGGGMQVAPAAELDDAAFDVVSMGDLNLLECARFARTVGDGAHLQMSKVSSRRARVVEAEPIDAGDEVELDIDGENLGRLPARFEVVPAALWMVVPAA